MRSWLWVDGWIEQVIVVGSVFGSEDEVCVGVGVGAEREEFDVGNGDLGILTVMGEDAIACCAASADSRIATMGRSSLFGLLLEISYWFVQSEAAGISYHWGTHLQVAEGHYLPEFLKREEDLPAFVEVLRYRTGVYAHFRGHAREHSCCTRH